VSFGVSLKRERELRGVSLEEISKATKISVRLLDAIEKNRFEILPEGVFRKSFIKSYAKYLGMNEEQILHEYDLEVQPSPPSQAAEKPSVSLRETSAGSKRALLLTLGILLLLVAAACGLWYLTRASRNVEPDPPAGQTTSVSQAPAGKSSSEAIAPPASTATPIPAESTPSPPASTTGAAGRAVSPVSSPSALKVLGELAKKPEPVAPAGTEGSTPLELTVEANNPVWISVSAGESPLFSGLMNPAESKKFSLEAPLRVVVGNAGGVRLQVNGQVFSSLGKAGERKTLEISAANYQQYLAPKTP
jgi:cytoskeleton protein RodZ